MGSQSRLVILLFLSLAVFCVARASTPHTPLNIVRDDIKDNEVESEEELLLPIRKLDSGIRISTPRVKQASTATTSSTEAKKASLTSTLKPVSDEVLNDLIEASKHSPVLADDPRFNEMLPDKLKLENTTSNENKGHDYFYDQYNQDYDDDYDSYEDTITHMSVQNAHNTTVKAVSSEKLQNNKSVHMKPIMEENKTTSKSAEIALENDIVFPTHVQNNETNNIDDKAEDEEDDEDEDEDEEDEDEDDDEDDDDEDDDIIDGDVVYSENVPCPRYCVCARNMNSYLVATCSRFDPGTQKFGADITDLIVTDVGPKYPILLGPEFFLHMGLKHVSSIKISNCTIQYLHTTAFHGLDDLYSVNLTNVGLALIHPDTFAKNKKLRLLTITGNELSVMSNVHYILKSSSIEELVLSRNNLIELNPHAFSQLSNVIYINLSHNNLKKIPDTVFSTVETLEELDLSYNSLKTLPEKIFERTSLSILHLKYNSITHDLHFGTNVLQQLDLSFNSIKVVHHGMFDKMIGLTNLNLRGNGITKISPDSFLTLSDLRHIDLSVNDLDQVSSMLFLKNSELDVIRLNDNPRLTHLPTDGFACNNGYFTVYYLDISNCAIGALGHKTFSTMPHIVTLKMSWNNINNLDSDTFGTLTKLNDLDLSNNLITRLDDLTFMNNSDITKLNLSGNTIRKLSTRLFLPLTKLHELDVSECELTALLADNELGASANKYKFFETLRSFNASKNQIKEISSNDVKYFKNLRTLDISHNPLKCNEKFQDFISYVSLNKLMSPNSQPLLSNIVNEASATMEELQAQRDWAKLALEVCKHHESLNVKTKEVNNIKDTKDAELEDHLKAADKMLEDDDLYLLSMMEKRKFEQTQRILKGKDKSAEHSDFEHFESVHVNKLHDSDLVKDDEEENESNYDWDDDDDDDYYTEDYNTLEKKQQVLEKTDKPKIVDHGVKVEEIDLREETKDKFLLNKFLLNGDDKTNDDNDDDDLEEIIIERGRIYYSDYKFLIPTIIIVSGVLVLLIVMSKIVALIMRKRGERYRMALLAASKNSIVYQKLCEEIKPPTKEPKQPKVHRYAPINQV